MWIPIVSKQQIQELKVGVKILYHPSSESDTSSNPSGQESNSELYQIMSISIEGLTVEYIAKNLSFGSMNVISMRKQIDINQLLGGNWWIEESSF